MNRLYLDIVVALGEAESMARSAPPDSPEGRVAAAVARELTAVRALLAPAAPCPPRPARDDLHDLLARRRCPDEVRAPA